MLPPWRVMPSSTATLAVIRRTQRMPDNPAHSPHTSTLTLCALLVPAAAPLQPYHYDVHLSASPPTPPPADALSGRSGSAAAGGGWEAEPAYLREQAAALAAQQAEDRKSGWHLTGRGGGRTRSAATAEPGSSSDDGAAPGVDIFWHSSYEHAAAPKPAKRQDRKSRSPAARRKGRQSERLLAAAPAFGQGALTKWH